jgi:hypothetical protein
MVEAITKQDKDNIEELEDEEEDDHVFNEKLQSRFYRKDFPEENDLVIVSSAPTPLFLSISALSELFAGEILVRQVNHSLFRPKS